jgi:hypothetical protein
MVNDAWEGLVGGSEKASIRHEKGLLRASRWHGNAKRKAWKEHGFSMGGV